jgi:hypothetical protein
MRKDASTELARAIAYRDAGNARKAEQAAMRLIAILVGAGILPPGLTVDRGRTEPPLELDAADLVTVGRLGRRHDAPGRWT